jgi:hypothetical protein
VARLGYMLGINEESSLLDVRARSMKEDDSALLR